MQESFQPIRVQKAQGSRAEGRESEARRGEARRYDKSCAILCFVAGPTRPALWIVPSWADGPLDDNNNNNAEDAGDDKNAEAAAAAAAAAPIAIILYPGLAFGTGEHPTTQLCLQLLYDAVLGKQCAAVVDYGCASLRPPTRQSCIP